MEGNAVVDWHPLDDKTRLQGLTAEEIVASRSEDKSRGNAYTDSFTLTLVGTTLEDAKADEVQLRGQAQQVINRALFKGLHPKAQPKLEKVEVLADDGLHRSVKFSWAVKVIPAAVDLDPASTIDKVQNADEEKHRDPYVSRDVGTGAE